MPPAEGRILRCAGCGAIQKESATGSCQYCGAKFAVPEPAPAPTPTPAPAIAEARAPSTLELLRWLEAQPDRAARFGQPSARVSGRQSEFTRSQRVQMGCGIALIVVAAWFLLPCFLAFGHPGRMLAYAVVPLAAAALGVFLVRGARNGIREVRADLVPGFAAIVDKRTHVETRNERAWTTYFATLELADGVRVELETAGDLYGGLRSGDVGVAWRNALGKVRLLDFRVLELA
ncbi:MAG: hypothetical protein EPO68_14840 [Planctomycetota bacterium]|nr:MAG: hypothetical protein EPO68_14840 [Planctomycetota bacterium]